MTGPRVSRQLWQQGQFTITYYSQCRHWDETYHGKSVVVSSLGEDVECYHVARLLRRDRTLMECLCAALDFVAQRNEEIAAANEEANLLAEEASALAEAAHSLATLSRA